jgi:plasmid rolling circle replication initiator protein Rep
MNQTLSDISSKDKPWNRHKRENRAVSKIYATSAKHVSKSERMSNCSGMLTFGELTNPESGEVSYKLIDAHFCRVRYCPICQWRRSLYWQARFYKHLPEIISIHPTYRFLYLTLTIKNCDVVELRNTLQDMNKAWHRLLKRKEFSIIKGWVRTTEITRGDDNSAHPHFHCLLMVPNSYFTCDDYVDKSEWIRVWKDVMRLDYEPSVDIRIVKSKKNTSEGELLPIDGLIETLKYSVKPSDMTANNDWFLELTEQTHRLRFIATGGLFKKILKKEDDITEEEMININNGEDNIDISSYTCIIRFIWCDDTKKYIEYILPNFEGYELGPPDG